MTKGQRISCLVIAICLFAFAIFQIFQPDPILGVSAFTAAGMMALLGYFEKINKIALLIGIVLFMAGAIVSFPVKEQDPNIFAPAKQMTFGDVQQSVTYFVLIAVLGYLWWLCGKIR